MTSESAPVQAKLARRELARRELSRRHSGDYAAYAFRGWQQADHHSLLADYLEQVELYVASCGQQGIGRLMVFIPPRHGKSLNVSVLFPPWFLGRNPDKRVIVSSYNGALAASFSRQARNTVIDTPFQVVFGELSSSNEPVKISDDSRSVEAWNLDGYQGGMVAAGVGGGITGRGAHLLIIDDPVRDRLEAESAAMREQVWSWYTSTAYTRLEEGGAVIVMMTRWHEDDLAGRLLKAMIEVEGADQWTVLCLPAIAEEWAAAVEPERVIDALKGGWWKGVDPLGRAPGEALWPDKYPLQELARIRANIGGYEWDALYQQRPRCVEGALIKATKIQVIDEHELPDGLIRARYWDLAVSGKRRADYIAGALGGKDKQGRFYILDMTRLRGPWADARPRMVQQMLADVPGIVQGIEVSGQQGGYYQELQRDHLLQERAIRPIDPHRVGDKVVRANLWASRIEDGLIYMLRGPWNDAFVQEALSFPRGQHDDQVDAVSGAWQMLSIGEPVRVYGGLV